MIAGATRRLLGGRLRARRSWASARSRASASRCGPTWSPASARSRAASRRRSGRSLPPMVGRDHELALLLERWRQAKDGEGQVRAARRARPGSASRASAAPCSSALADEPHSPRPLSVLALPHRQRAAAGDRTAGARGGPRGRRSARGQARPAGGAARPLRRPRRRAPDRRRCSALDGVARYGRSICRRRRSGGGRCEALVDQLLGLAARQPVLVVLEDAHWIDPTHARADRSVTDRIAAARCCS